MSLRIFLTRRAGYRRLPATVHVPRLSHTHTFEQMYE